MNIFSTQFLRRACFAATLALSALSVLPASTVYAQPVPENERIPIDVRRTTLVVRDIDKSLPLYRSVATAACRSVAGATDSLRNSFSSSA